jgi:glycosyltransferase involved in cell wall biosynthesis
MRILLVTHRYPPFGLSGVERLSEQTATALAAAGHEVTVLTRREAAAPPLAELQRSERAGIPVITLAGDGPLQGRFPGPQPRMERLFERTLLEVSPDVVLISHLMGHSPLYVSLAHRWRVPVVLELHDFYLACERAHLERVSGELCDGPEGGRACAQHCFFHDGDAIERWSLRSHLFRHALEHADATVCPSQFVARYFQRTFALGAPPTVIGNGVDIGAAGRSRRSRRSAVDAPGTPRQLRLACVGMVAPHKGVHVIIEALRLALLPSVRLTLFGGVVAPYFRSVRDAAAEVENLELLAYGGFAPSDLPLLLGDIDAVIVPSLVWETYSIVSREALSLGIPVIASRIGALPEAIRHGHNGWLFTPGSAEELARLLHVLAHDPDMLAELRAGIRPADWISTRERVRALTAVLEGVVDRGPPVTDRFALQELDGLRGELLSEAIRV